MRLVAAATLLALVAILACAPDPVRTPDPVGALPAAVAVSADTAWAWPERAENLQVLPPDTPPERLRVVMQGANTSLGVQCDHCHVGEPGAPFATWDFASDAKPTKATARAMMEMTWQINERTLPAVEALGDAEAWRVTCWTCHRGSPTPDR